jgi:hypothetical protein
MLRNVHDPPQSISLKIQKLLSQNPHEEFNSKYIATLIKANPSSVRSALFRLANKGYVVRVHRGFYKWATDTNISETRHGVGELPLRVHNVIVVCRIPRDVDVLKLSHGEYDLRVEDVRFRFSHGVKRRKITVRFSCDDGLDFRGFVFAIELIRSYVLRFYGFEPSESELHVVSCEFNQDYQGLRLDGVKCLTVSDLKGVLERIYQKKENLVRSEVKVKKASVETIYALLKGGVTSYNIVQGLYTLVKKVENLVEGIKYLNQVNLEMRDVLLKILKRLGGI